MLKRLMIVIAVPLITLILPYWIGKVLYLATNTPSNVPAYIFWCAGVMGIGFSFFAFLGIRAAFFYIRDGKV